MLSIWRNSLLFAAMESLARSYDNSILKRLWDNICDSGNTAPASVYGRFLARLEAFVYLFEKPLKNSLIYKLLTGIKSLYLKLTENSFIFGLVNRMSLKRWMLLCFIMYLPLEFVLRDCIGGMFEKAVIYNLFLSIWEELMMVAACALIAWRTATRQADGSLSRCCSINGALVLYIVVMLALMLYTCPKMGIAVAGFRAQVEYTVWFFIILRLIDTKEDGEFVLRLFFCLVMALAIHGIIQYILGVEIPASWTTSTEAGIRTRSFSITGSPNILGALLVMGAPIAACGIYYFKKPLHKFMAFCATGIICLADLFTFSRGSWVALCVTVLIFAFFIDKRLILCLMGAIAAVLTAVPSIASRLAFLFSEDYKIASATAGRSIRWATGREILHTSNPWTGFGLGRFGGAVAMNNQVIKTADGFQYFYMDNYYLKTEVEAGYIGLAAFIFLLVVFVFCSFKAVRKAGSGFASDRSKDELIRNAGNPKLLCAAVFSGMAGVLVHSYFENLFEEPYMMAYFWALAAVIAALGFYTDISSLPPSEK